MDLKLLSSALLRWSWVVVLGAALAGAAAHYGSGLITPRYQATTTTLIRHASENGTAGGLTTLIAIENPTTTLAELMVKRPILEAVIANLELAITPEELVKQVSIKGVRETPVLYLTVEDQNPQTAAAIANEIIRVFNILGHEIEVKSFAVARDKLLEEIAKTQEAIIATQAEIERRKPIQNPFRPLIVPTVVPAADIRLQVELAQYQSNLQSLQKNLEDVQIAEMQALDILTVIEPAKPQEMPVWPRPILNIALATILGALIATGLVLVVELANDRVVNGADLVRLTGLPALTAIPRVWARKPAKRLVTVAKPKSGTAEIYRRLAATIAFTASEDSPRIIAVTGNRPGDGGTTAAANLAVALAQIGKLVIVVDADLRKPQLHRFFGQANERGLATAIQQPIESPLFDHSTATGLNNLLLVPAGPVNGNSTELLGSPRFRELLDELAAQCDYLILNSPPLSQTVDAMLLLHAGDGTVLAVAAGTRSGAISRAHQRIGQAGAHLLGIILTNASRSATRQIGSVPLRPAAAPQPRRSLLGAPKRSLQRLARIGRPAIPVAPIARATEITGFAPFGGQVQ